MSTSRKGSIKRWEQRFERLLWKLRRVAILPVIMSLVSTVVTFTLGTMEIAGSILELLAGS
ncbi:YqhA family protein, partial [Synechococcus sp. EJ6-Ellesmere]|nr:YqhA family protein [Synechococcus sp. EJ6-Ellesmere]